MSMAFDPKAPADAATIAALRDEHGEVFAHDDFPGVIFSRPSRAAWKRFKSAVLDPKLQAGATDNLFADVVLYPAHGTSECKALLDKYPAASDVIAEMAAALARGEDAARAKKL